MPHFDYEIAHGRDAGILIAGTDEAGRGPLAGPVMAAAVIIPASFPQELMDAIEDSKKLSIAAREKLYPLILDHCDFCIAEASVAEIDRINILQASLLAMQRAVLDLKQKAQLVLVDGNKAPKLAVKTIPIVKGDGISLSIAAASILAKVARDRLMGELALEFPHYGWAQNAGYPTPEHLAALIRHGITPHHRRSFAPVSCQLSRISCQKE